jgi:hypothetical protein
MLDMIHSTLNRQFSDVAGGLGEVVELGGELFGYGSSFIPPLLKGGMGGLTGPEIGGTAGGPQKAGGEAESGSTVFTAPICDLFIEMFDLDESNWLRRQAIVVILQQFLGSTIERCVSFTNLDDKLILAEKFEIRSVGLHIRTAWRSFWSLFRICSFLMVSAGRPARNAPTPKSSLRAIGRPRSLLCSYRVSSASARLSERCY